MGKLDGKKALITGGGSGIGFAVARRFHQEGAYVVICGRRKQVLARAKSQISPESKRIHAIPCDVTDEIQVKKLINETLKVAGGLDILVNNAGIMRFGSMEESDPTIWDQVMTVNAFAPWRLMVAVVPIMRKQGEGAIVNLSSIAGHKALPGAGIYCTSKAALQMLSQVMALELAGDKIRINMICPGLVEETELADSIFGKEGVPDFYKKLRPLHPLGRSGKPGDVADLALFLASDESSWITGAIIPLDGGRHMASNRPKI